MPTLKIRFVSGKGWDSRLIEWYSRCRWSHVEILVGDYTFGAQLKGGLKWRSIHDYCYRNAQCYEVWEIPLTDGLWEELLYLIVSASGTPYDWPAILSFVLGPHRLHLKGRYICSGFEAGVLSSLGLAVINLPIENYSPRDIWMVIPNIAGARRISDGK